MNAAAAAWPAPCAWQAAAQARADLFDPLDAGARVALVARREPRSMLVWEVGDDGRVVAGEREFAGFASCGADIALSADEDALACLAQAPRGRVFEVLRAGIRTGSIVCYILRRRCQLEERGFEELLTELGFAFMGACR